MSSVNGCYCNDFVDDNFSAHSYNAVVDAVIAVRSDFSFQGVSLSCLLEYGNKTGCKGTMAKYTHIDDPLRTLPWRVYQCEVEGIQWSYMGTFFA